ncbi:MAG: DUF2242 domain-containing protein [Burkholderiales bacterium]|nr:MAG: DUF2242 domain-containing protein [Burkholderiales bacterium]
MNRITHHAVSLLRALLLGSVALASGCAGFGGFGGGGEQVRVYEREVFDRPTAFSREFVASPADTCNAARRALLSQGYIVQSSQDEQMMDARKRFQPEAESHVQIEFHVVCSPLARGQPTSVAFVSAVQDRYTVKKNPMSASVGVSPFGSISLPWASATDSLVKIGSETIPPGRFYDRFFDLVEQFLSEQKGLDEPVPIIAVPTPAALPGKPASDADRKVVLPVTLPANR